MPVRATRQQRARFSSGLVPSWAHSRSSSRADLRDGLRHGLPRIERRAVDDCDHRASRVDWIQQIEQEPTDGFYSIPRSRSTSSAQLQRSSEP